MTSDEFEREQHRRNDAYHEADLRRDALVECNDHAALATWLGVITAMQELNVGSQSLG